MSIHNSSDHILTSIDEFCDEIIKTFDYYQSINDVYCEDVNLITLMPEDLIENLHSMGPSLDEDPLPRLYEPMQECLDEYRYARDIKRCAHVFYCSEGQKTPPGGRLSCLARLTPV